MSVTRFLAGTILCVVPFFCAEFTHANVNNASFESWNNGQPTDWTTIDSGILVDPVSTPISDGATAARITVTTGSQSNTDLRQTVALQANQSVTFSADVYHTDGGVRARLYVDGYHNYSNPSLTHQWQTLSHTITPSQDTTISVGLRFYYVTGFDGSEVVYVDNFRPSSGAGTPPVTCQDTTINLFLNTDNYASETSWQLQDSAAQVLATGNGYANNSNYHETFCLADGSYRFIINDSYGDGICCSYGAGEYRIEANAQILISGGQFGHSESQDFVIGGTGSGGDLGTYYQSAAGLSGFALKSALHNIIKGHAVQGYGALWGFYSAHELDVYYENDGSILDIYSENPTGADSYNYTPISNQCGTYNSEADCYNREHSFPRNWFGGSIEPMNSDVHHIFASDGYVNSKRSNYPYGVVGSASFTSHNGSRAGSAVAGLGYNGDVFEPNDAFKGDVARAQFYMATRYQNSIAGWQNNSTTANAVLNGTSDQVFESWYLALLKSWHEADPVSQKERDRNDAAHIYQGNRNPFVDHPEFVNSIWPN